MKRISIFMLVIMMVFMTSACGKDSNSTSREKEKGSSSWEAGKQSADQTESKDAPDGFVKIQGGTFQMGSPDTEKWRSDDETAHSVTVSDFYMGVCEVTQAEYQEITGKNPSNFKGDDLPAENLTWYEAAAYCNARSEKEGLEKAYTIDGQNVTWNRSADGYRLPTEAEWEYACRAGTETHFLGKAMAIH